MGVISILDVGHQTFVGNLYAREFLSKPDTALRYIRGGVLWALIIGFIKTIALLAAASIEQEDVVRSMLPVLLLQSFLTAQVGILNQILRVHGKYAFAVLLSNGTILSATIAALFGVMYGGSYKQCLLYYSLIRAVLEIGILLVGYSLYHPNIHKTIWKEFVPGGKNLISSTSFLFQNLCDAILTVGSVVVLEHFASPSDAASYASVRTLANFMVQGMHMAVTPITHDFIRLYNLKQFIRLRALQEVISICMGLFITCTLAFGFGMGQLLIERWTHGKFGDLQIILGSLLLATGFRVASISSFAIMQALNRGSSVIINSTIRAATFCIGMLAVTPTAENFGFILLASEFAGFISLPYLWKLERLKFEVGSIHGLLGSSAIPFISALIVWIIRPNPLSGAFIILASGVVGLLVRLKQIDRETFSYIIKYLVNLKSALESASLKYSHMQIGKPKS